MIEKHPRGRKSSTMRTRISKEDELPHLVPEHRLNEPIEVIHIFGRSPRWLVDEPRNLICARKYVHENQNDPKIQHSIFMRQCQKYGFPDWLEWAIEAAKQAGMGKKMFALNELLDSKYPEGGM